MQKSERLKTFHTPEDEMQGFAHSLHFSGKTDMFKKTFIIEVSLTWKLDFLT